MPLDSTFYHQLQLSFQPNRTITNDSHLNRHIYLDEHIKIMAPMATHYRDHHKIVKAIEKCSLQETFGPEVTSTEELLPKESDASSVVTLKASRNSDINPIKKRVFFNKIPFFSAKPHFNMGSLPINPTNENSKNLSRTTKIDNMHTISANKDGSMPAVIVNEDSMTPFHQSKFLGQVPLEIWGQKVSIHAFTSLSVSFANIIIIIRLKSFENRPARKESIVIFMTYLTQITSTQIITVRGTPKTFSALAVPRIL